MATILRAYNEDNTKYDLDVFNEQQFLLDISAIESGDIGKVFGISSQTFALPPTPNNAEYFGNLYDLGATPSINFIKTFPCQVINDGVTIFNGRIYLDSVITDNDGDIIYNVNVVNETIDFKYLVKELTFGDIDWSDYNHDYTFTNISSSWDENLFSGDVVYPLVEYGYTANDVDASQLKSGGSEGTFTNSTSPLQVRDFKPAIRIKSVLDKIFDTLEYKYTSSFFESSYADSIYMLTTKDATRGNSFTNPTEQQFLAENTSVQTLPNIYTPTKVIFDNEIYDNAGNYTAGTSTFRAGADGKYSFDVQLNTQLSGSTASFTPRTLLIDLYVNGSPVSGLAGVWYNYKGLANNARRVVTANFKDISLTAGDNVTIYASYETEGTTDTLGILGTGYSDDTFFKCYQSPLEDVGGNVDFKGVFNADESVLDFLNGLIQKFNLVIEPLKNNPKVLSIEPFNDWVDAGETKDWTDIVDRSVKWEIRHPMSTQPSKIYFSDEEDKDSANQYSINNLNKTFGDRYYFSESDLADGERKIGSYFAPTPMKFIEGTTNFIVPRIYTLKDGKKERFAFKPRLLHYVGLKDSYLTSNRGGTLTQNEWYVEDENGSLNTLTQHPVFHHNNELPATENTLDLHFGNPNHWEYHQNYVNARTIHDAFYDYWAFYINELYDIDARLLTCNVVLKPTDIPSIALNDKIFIDGHYYRINKISSANLTNEQSTKVELIKSLPRKSHFPRRRILDDIGTGFKDVYVGDVNVTGGFDVTYHDWNTDTPITSSVEVERGGFKDRFNVYTGSVVIASPMEPIEPNDNVVLGVNYVDDRASGVVVQGGGNFIQSGVENVSIVGNGNKIQEGTRNINLFGNNITTTGSVDTSFFVNTTTSSVSIDNVSGIVAFNPTEPINSASFNGEAGVVLGNARVQGGQYFDTDILTGSAGLTFYLTGSHVNHYVHLFSWSGSAGTANYFLEDANNVDGISMRFITDGVFAGSEIINIAASSSQTINGSPETSLSSSYAVTTIQAVDGAWYITDAKS